MGPGIRYRVAAVAAGIAITVCAPVAASASTSSGSGHVLSVGTGYIHEAQYRPRTTYLSGDSSLYLRKTVWKTWDKNSAHGHGIARFDTCKRSCAAGPFKNIPATITESKPTKQCGKRVFGQIRIHFARRPEKHDSRTLILDRSNISC